MNQVQMIIVAVVLLLVFIVIGYYLYQEAKFKNLVDSNFNQATDDALSGNNAVVFDGIDGSENSSTPLRTGSILEKDVHQDSFIVDEVIGLDEVEPTFAKINVAQEVVEVELQQPEIFIPEDSLEAFFAKIEEVPFIYTSEINKELDLVIDIVFEEVKKLKILPDITQFTHKPFMVYVLDSENKWSIFERGQKYVARALKIVVQLVDRDGVISQAQIENIYKELRKFILNNDAHIRQSDYENAILNIQNQLKHLANMELDLELYLVSKDSMSYGRFAGFCHEIGFVEKNGRLVYRENDENIFVLSPEGGGEFKDGPDYNLWLIDSKLHLIRQPGLALERIFDFAEKFVSQFDARLLTTNKKVFTQKDYDSLNRYVKNYAHAADANGIKFGGTLIKRLYV